MADETRRLLGRLRAASDFELCQWFLCGFRLKVRDLYGFASFREHAERWFGCSGRATEERVRVAERLDELPKLSAAFAAGDLVYSAVRELTRVADAETEAEWLEVADGKTASQIERMTSGKKPGDRPSDPTRPELERKRVTLNLSPSAYALLRQARDVLRKESGGTHLDDDAFIELLASSFLAGGGGADETRSRHQIALTVCECCKAATQDANGEQVPVGPEVVEVAECDAQIIGRVDISAGYERASQVIPPAVRRAVVRRHGGVCAVPGCKNTSCDVHHCDPKSEGGSHDPERLVLLCSAHHGIVHGGKVVIRGTWSEGFVFEHVVFRHGWVRLRLAESGAEEGARAGRGVPDARGAELQGEGGAPAGGPGAPPRGGRDDGRAGAAGGAARGVGRGLCAGGAGGVRRLEQPWADPHVGASPGAISWAGATRSASPPLM